MNKKEDQIFDEDISSNSIINNTIIFLSIIRYISFLFYCYKEGKFYCNK